MKYTAVLMAAMVVAVCADIIPVGYHPFSRCVKITNADSLGGIVLISYCKVTTAYKNIILQDKCLVQGYRYASYYILWSYRDSVAARTLDGLDFDGVISGTNTNEPLFVVSDDINPNGGNIEDANPLVAEEDYYRLCEGFQLALWKKISKFNDGTPDLTETFPIASEKVKKSPREKVFLSFTESGLLYSMPIVEPVTLEFYDPSGKLAIRMTHTPAGVQGNRVALPRLAAGNYIVKLKSAHYGASSAVTIKR